MKLTDLPATLYIQRSWRNRCPGDAAEAFGAVRQAMSVLKKRTGRHEKTIREFHISQDGITVGPPLEQFQGVLRGIPEFIGTTPPLKDNNP